MLKSPFVSGPASEAVTTPSTPGTAFAFSITGAVLVETIFLWPGVGSYIHENPFEPVLDEKVRITHEHLRNFTHGEDVAAFSPHTGPSARRCALWHAARRDA